MGPTPRVHLATGQEAMAELPLAGSRARHMLVRFAVSIDSGSGRPLCGLGHQFGCPRNR
jgi:hypothetical protein